MAAEERKKSFYKVERACTIDINDDTHLEYDAAADTIAFTSDEDEAAPLFVMTYEGFEDLFNTMKAERERIRALEAAAKKA